MSTAKRPGGVIIRDAHLQIDLRGHGYGRERLDLEPTPGNIKYAERLRTEILGKIERGEHVPTLPLILKIARALKCSSAHLMALTEAKLAEAAPSKTED